MIPKTQFFEQYGCRLAQVTDEQYEDIFLLFHPEESEKALKLLQTGDYEIASVFEAAFEGEDDMISIDNDISDSPYKIGYYVLVKDEVIKEIENSRLSDVKEQILECISCNDSIPKEVLDEYRELINKLKQ